MCLRKWNGERMRIHECVSLLGRSLTGFWLLACRITNTQRDGRRKRGIDWQSVVKVKLVYIRKPKEFRGISFYGFCLFSFQSSPDVLSVMRFLMPFFSSTSFIRFHFWHSVLPWFQFQMQIFEIRSRSSLVFCFPSHYTTRIGLELYII